MYEKIGAFALILSVPLAFVLPPALAFENGVIENSQVAVLILFAAANFRLAAASSSRLRWFHVFCAMLGILFAFRELSWGRVFFQTGTAPTGEPYFIMMADYPYRAPVHAFLAVYILAMLFVLFRFLPVKEFLFSRKPVGALAVMFVAILLAQIGEHGWIIDKMHGEILEELDEVVAYLMMPKICLYYRNFLRGNIYGK